MVGVRSSKGEHHTGIGKGLAKKRTAYKVSLEQISEQLHIPVVQLRALEEEDYSVFSAELYARGAYTVYAKYLGVYSAKDLRAILRALSTVRTRVPLRLLTPDRLFDRLLNPRLVIILIGLCIALIVGGYIAWQVQSFWRFPDLVITSPTQRVFDSADTTIEGKTEPDARLTINDQQVLVQSDNRFSAQLSLHIGMNVVSVEVGNAAGRISKKELFLLREK
jgi:cytoskeletal protein RodZ